MLQVQEYFVFATERGSLLQHARKNGKVGARIVLTLMLLLASFAFTK